MEPIHELIHQIRKDISLEKEHGTQSMGTWFLGPKGESHELFHELVLSALDEVRFRDKKAPYTVREYDALPMIIDGLDVQADGAPSRPTLTVANIGTLFSSSLDGFKNDDLVITGKLKK